MPEPLSWSDVYQRREHEALLSCARAVDSLNATLYAVSADWDFVPANVEPFHRSPMKPTIGPIEMQMWQRLGLIADASPAVVSLNGNPLGRNRA